MSDTKQHGSQDRSAGDAGALLQRLVPGLTSKALSETARTAESIDTVRFGFNPWAPIWNVALKGFGMGIQIALIERMKLIPLVAWKTPVYIPRSSGWALGALSVSGGAFPSGSVGTKVEHRIQFPIESAENILIAYGPGGSNDTGFRMLDSLTADTDVAKIDAIGLFRGVMESGEKPGISLPLEALADFLDTEAKSLLKFALDNGVEFVAKNKPYRVTLSPAAYPKGEAMLDELRTSIAIANERALKVLEATKADIADAKMGAKDVKRKLDTLDKFLLTQRPTFSLDSEVERAGRALQPLVDSMRTDRDGADGFSKEELIAMMRQTADINARLAARILKDEESEAAEAKQPPPPPVAPTGDPAQV